MTNVECKRWQNIREDNTSKIGGPDVPQHLRAMIYRRRRLGTRAQWHTTDEKPHEEGGAYVGIVSMLNSTVFLLWSSSCCSCSSSFSKSGIPRIHLAIPV